ADPTAAILSVALLLGHLGLEAEAARVTAAVEADIVSRSADAQRSTTEIGDAIVSAVVAGAAA
ncbi:MAG TPA: isocitrate/isopropylmalate family dehydrogenase, partial [Microbacteriaceae bacterium]|nr:isocitrate/isopropylmalate family dehydrogenase [Microbacteriaceae bacterium]